MTEKEKRSLKIRLGQRLSYDKSRVMEIIKEEIDKTETTMELHGEWIEHKWAEEFDGLLISNYECSHCHVWKRENTDFCPDCGADMRKKEGEKNESDHL